MRIKPSLLLECHVCGWRPKGLEQVMVIAKHFAAEHPDIEQPHLDLAAVCACGTTMKLTASRPAGGGFKDWFLCLACGNEGFIRREKGDPSYKTPQEAPA